LDFGVGVTLEVPWRRNRKRGRNSCE